MPDMHVILLVTARSSEKDPLRLFDPVNDFLTTENSYLTWRRSDQRLPSNAVLYSFKEYGRRERIHRTFSGEPLFPPYAVWSRRLMKDSKQIYEHSEFFGLFEPLNWMEETYDKLVLANKFVEEFFPGEYHLPMRYWLDGPGWRQLGKEFARKLIARQAEAA